MKILSNNRGQMAVEYILVMFVMMIALKVIANYMTRNEVLASFVAKPWEVLAGVIENGVPVPPAKGQDLHPNHISRHVSLQGDQK